MSRRPDKHAGYRPTGLRTRLLIVALAVVTAGVVMYAVLDPQARLERSKRPPADRPMCKPGQSEDCVGGKVDVIIIAPAPPASTAAR